MDKDEAKELVHVEKRLQDYSNKDKQVYLRGRLSFACQMLQRRPDNVVPFSDAENDKIVSLSYQAFDWLIDLIARGSEAELEGFVADPKSFVEHRRETAVVAQDATPVYMDMSTGKGLIRAAALDETRRRKRD